MAKLIDYAADTRFNSDDILIKDGSNGTKKILVTNAAVEFAGMVSAINRRNVYREKILEPLLPQLKRRLFKPEHLTICSSEITGLLMK